MTQFLASSIDKSLSSTDAWIDIDLSSDIPAGATGAIIRVINTHTSWRKFGLRKKGSTDDRYGEAEATCQGFHIIPVDSNRKIQGKIESTLVDFYLIGYTEADVTLFTNGTNKAPEYGAWTDMDLSSELPAGAVAAIFEIHNSAEAPRSWGLRKKGSTDDRYDDFCESRCFTFVVPVDGNRKCQGKIETPEVDFYLMGYLTSGTTETNGIDHSLGSVDTWTEITETNAPSGATGVWLEYITNAQSSAMAARKKGSSEDIYRCPNANHTLVLVPIDSNKKWEGKIEVLGNDWYTLGYFSGGAVLITATDIAGAVESASVSTFHAVTVKDIAGAVESASRSAFHAVTTEDIAGASEGASAGGSGFHAVTVIDIAGTIESADVSTFHAVTVTDIAGAIESASANAVLEWVNTGDLAGATDVESLLLKGEAIYAGTGPNGNVFKSVDDGVTWVNTGDLADTEGVDSLLLEGTTIYAGTGPNGNVFKSVDGGVTWVNTGDLADTEGADSLLLEGTTIYAGTGPNGNVFKLVDGGANHALYIGADFKFRAAKIKYSTKGVPAAGSAITVEFSQGDANWKQLDVSCESRFFTETPGTYFLIIPHLPSDWERDTVNGTKHFWLRFRITAGSYTTPPKIDRIILSRADPYRVYFFNRPARSILAEVLEGTGYSMDETDLCPTDEISLVAEYQTNLLLIPGIANALTWEDAEGKHSYQWWIDSSKKVHMKTKRGNSHGDLTGNLTLLHHFLDHFNISNKLHFMGNYGGINQIHALIEDTQSQDAWNTREIMVPEKNHNDYQSLKLSAEKAMVYTKDPLQKIPAELDTRYWLDNGFEVGDRVVLHQSTWGIEEREYQIVRAVIGPKTTSLDLGVSQEHLNALKADMQRKLDISDVRMSGSTSVFMIGPVNDNYEREADGTAHPARLKIEIPEGTRYIHKVTLSWVLGPYRADVSGGGDIPAHDHGGFGGAGGAFTPEIEDGCGHNTSEGQKTLTIKEEVKAGYLLTDNYAVAENTHVHGMYNTGVGTAHKHEMKLSGDIITYSTANGYLPTSVWVSYDGAHSHPLSDTGGPSSTVWVLNGLSTGDACATSGCYCVDFTDLIQTKVGSDTHTHANSDTDEEGPHDHYMSAGLKHYYLHSMTIKNPAWTEDESDHVHPNVATKPGSSHTHKLTVMQDEWGEDTYIPLLIRTHPSFADPADPDEPEHAHDIVPTPDMPITGIPEAAHSDHAIAPDPGGAVALEYGIHEEPGGTTLELIINDETVGNQYNGNQTAIRIEGFLKAGSNTVALQPIVAEAGKKGGAAFSGAAFVFIEDASF